ncbi:MAG: hypothetical protein J6Y37_12380 [Paludibacteraceae bacterium]|nr:hypothetical protein [Paludibacteraceae bacterium]
MEKTYEIGLWSGAGYCVSEFEVTAFSEDHALEVLSERLIREGLTGLYETDEEHEKTREWLGITEDEELEGNYGWCYVDGTMEGAPYPIWVRTENMKIVEKK